MCGLWTLRRFLKFVKQTDTKTTSCGVKTGLFHYNNLIRIDLCCDTKP